MTEHDKLTLISLGINERAIQEEADGTVIIREDVNWEGRLINGIIPVKIKSIYGDLDISRNNLTSLENCPENVFGLFNCSKNDLKSLKGAPFVCRTFRCIDNPSLMDIESAPFTISETQGDFDGTRIAQQVKEIYRFACKKGCWNARENWHLNMVRLYYHFPSMCRKWGILDEYYTPNRGGVLGEDLGIL